MTNPNNSVGTNGAYGGRTSVNAFNDILGGFSRGILSGWVCSPSSGLVVVIGGDGTTRDVAIAEDNAGNKTTINNISGSPISVTIPSAPASNSRIDLIVAYVDNPPEGVSTTADNPAACGLIVVSGTAASTPIAPNDSAIRTAITVDGASGTTAYYVILGQITISSGTTNIVSGDISQAGYSLLNLNQLGDDSITSAKLDMSTLGGDYSLNEVNTGYKWIDGKFIYKKSIYIDNLPSDVGLKNFVHGISNLGEVIKIEGCVSDTVQQYTFPVNSAAAAGSYIRAIIHGANIQIDVGMDRSNCSGYITIYYTKTS